MFLKIQHIELMKIADEKCFRNNFFLNVDFKYEVGKYKIQLSILYPVTSSLYQP